MQNVSGHYAERILRRDKKASATTQKVFFSDTEEYLDASEQNGFGNDAVEVLNQDKNELTEHTELASHRHRKPPLAMKAGFCTDVEWVRQ